MPRLVDTYIENRWLVQPNHANTLGATHGGNVLKWMDEVGAMSAMRFAGENCVTVAMDGVEFTRPVRVGETAVVEAYVYDAGHTSIDVILRAARENPRTGDQEPTTESEAVYVAVDEDGDPTPVPTLSIETDRGVRLRERAADGQS